MKSPETMDPSDDLTAFVGVRPEVMAEAEHTFGNLFHRLHFFAQKLVGRGVEGAESLEETISTLEEVLQLVLDYTCPLAVEFRTVPTTTVAGSAAAVFGCPHPILPGALVEEAVTIDPPRLSRAFALMRGCLPEKAECHLTADFEGDAEGRQGVRWLRLSGTSADALAEARKSIAGRDFLAWALAQKLIEAQGGNLSPAPAGNGAAWILRLPLRIENT